MAASPRTNVTSYDDSSPGTCYDVFLSFRGEDTRNSFTDHLYEALVRAGFLTFRDNDEIGRGQELKPEIERAIKASRASIVVLSQNYATSTWCLEELRLILQQRKDCKHFVLPVFYHVDPSDVRKQDKTFQIQVKTSLKWTADDVKRWIEALTKVADLTGEVIKDEVESKHLKKIVKTMYRELDDKKYYLPCNLTAMDIRYKEIDSWLYRSDVRYVAIYGMGGSGKTTLAKYIYNSNWKNFESMCFVEDIGKIYKRSHELLKPQKQLLEEISGGNKVKIHSVSSGTTLIRKVLKGKKALIVLDDVVEEGQLDVLLGTGEIHAESKIIITTDANIENWFKFSSSKCRRFKMKLLNDDESLELLSLHVFGRKIPTNGFKDLALQAVKYCEGNPLALEVLGKNLAKDITDSYWKSLLRASKKDLNSKIQDVLRRSYDSLPPGSVRELFLHIACFFIGKDMDYVKKILEPDYCAVSGIKILTDRGLLSVSPSNKVMMHRLFQEMGRNIVLQESFTDPLERSRVWLNSDSHEILSKGKGSRRIIGLTLDMHVLEEEEEFKSSDLKTDALQMMDNLKLLQLNYVQLTGSYGNFSADLRWLSWLGFRLRAIPSELDMRKIVALDMSYSNLEVFDPPMVLKSLKILNLKDSHKLSEICNINKIPHLETLIIWNCDGLVRVCETIGDLKYLTVLNMTGCKGLKASTFVGGVTDQPTISLPRSLQQLFLQKNNLRILNLSYCSRFKWLQCLPSTLAELYVYHCESLEKITFQSHQFTLKEFGYEGCSNLYEVEGFMKLVPVAKLDETDLGHMKWLKEYQNHEVSLVGDDELTKNRSQRIQMLYEFNIMSTSLLDIKELNRSHDYISESPFVSFDVPPGGRKLKGLNVTFKYTLSGEKWAWFAKISSTNKGVDLMYNPKVFGKPALGEVGIWLSYWPIGNILDIEDEVIVSIIVVKGLEIRECGVSLVYIEDEVANETLQNDMEWEELSGFKLRPEAYYLCRRDFFEPMEVDSLTPSWFKCLMEGAEIDYTEIQGWRMIVRPKPLNPPFTTEEKMPEMSKKYFVDKSEERSDTNGRYGKVYQRRSKLSRGVQEEIYRIPEMSKSSLADKTAEFTSIILGEAKDKTVGYRSFETESPAYGKQMAGEGQPVNQSLDEFVGMSLVGKKLKKLDPPAYYM